MKTKSSSKALSKKNILAKTALYDSPEFCEQFNYSGSDLGVNCSASGTEFRVWAPTADALTLRLFSSFFAADTIEEVPMQKLEKGVWYYSDPRSLHGVYYTYYITIDGKTSETTDPYARACCANGARSMVIDLKQTNPPDWENDCGPKLSHPTDAILYELHIRDISCDISSGIVAKGKFSGLAETKTTNKAGLSTGLDHIKELGVTHVHLLPSFDYNSVDETSETAGFNWGYDPANYNIPEGSYSSNANDGAVRVREFKELIHALHSHQIGVIMDVVYNHTAVGTDSHFNCLVPYYYYRMCSDGSFSNGSGCGNETASERFMMRNFIVDSVAYWAEEYHIDGFRFDLMGLHDIETMRAIRKRLDKINPELLIYGEGWTAGDSLLLEKARSTKQNISSLPGVAVFNDNLRDALKGNVFFEHDRGFVSNKKNLCEDVRFGICGCTAHPQLDFEKIQSADQAWAFSPAQCINYVSAHDNLTLWDKLFVSCRSASRKLRVRMNLLAAAVYLTSQGIPFFQAGEEFLRSKPDPCGEGFVENSYNFPDSVNSLKWNELTKNKAVCEYYCGLIAFRKAHPALRLSSAEQIAKHLLFLQNVPENTVGYLLTDHAGQDDLKEICILFNPNRSAVSFSIPDGAWDIYAQEDKIIGTVPLGRHTKETIEVAAVSCTILGRA